MPVWHLLFASVLGQCCFLCRNLLFHPLFNFTPLVCHCPLPLLFGPLHVWMRGLRLCSPPTSGHPETARICSQLHVQTMILLFFSGIFLWLFILLLSACNVFSPIFICTKPVFPQPSSLLQLFQQNLDAVVRCELQGVACDVCGVRWMCEVCGVGSEV